ncbi:M24 family metallopeptidase [Singulisphaera sp. PoT]|uniref:M24 family metallopeptidase n=1 Tax=Singulisphaera sp. PoT TaxID=3411797 RepID=UPI003BF47595
MLTAEGCAARRKRLWDHLPSPCDVLILADPQHLIYFANYAQSPFVFRTSDAGAFLILEPGKATLVSDNVSEPFWEGAAVDEVVAPVWYEAKSSAGHRQGVRLAAAIEVLNRSPHARVGVEMASVPVGLVEALRSKNPGLELVDLDPVIRPLRRAKDADELAILRKSMKAGEAAQAAALERVKPGMTELAVFELIQQAAIDAIDEQALVYGDFVSGPRCEIEKGGIPSTRVIQKGELLMLDFSVVVFGYRGDFTNTFAVGGEPTPRQRELFQACVDSIKAGEKVLKAGVACRDVDAAVRGHLADLGLAHAFPSHTGHGLGLGHPDPPYLVPESTETLIAGDVVALEPGLYIEGEGGMRFERNYLITPTGYETLSNHKLEISQGK